jgi:hypothetical protein
MHENNDIHIFVFCLNITTSQEHSMLHCYNQLYNMETNKTWTDCYC